MTRVRWVGDFVPDIPSALLWSVLMAFLCCAAVGAGFVGAGPAYFLLSGSN